MAEKKPRLHMKERAVEERIRDFKEVPLGYTPEQAIEEAATEVGHETATLRGQYLVPHLEESFMKDGTIIKNLKKSSSERIARRYLASRRIAKNWLNR